MPVKGYSSMFQGLHPRITWNADKTGIVHVGEEHNEPWISLFIDLVYVAMNINLANMIKNCGSSNLRVICTSVLIIVIMFNSRMSIDEFSNRFFANDIFNRMVYYVYTFGVYIMTMNIVTVQSESSGSYGRLLYTDFDLHNCEMAPEYVDGFAIGFIITRFSLVVLYSMVCYDDPKAQEQFMVVLIRNLLSLLVMVLMFSQDNFLATLLTVAIIEGVGHVAIPTLYSHSNKWVFSRFLPSYKYHFPLDIYEVQHRLGIFIMMVLGEAVIQLLQIAYDTHHEGRTYYFNT